MNPAHPAQLDAPGAASGLGACRVCQVRQVRRVESDLSNDPVREPVSALDEERQQMKGTTR